MRADGVDAVVTDHAVVRLQASQQVEPRLRSPRHRHGHGVVQGDHGVGRWFHWTGDELVMPTFVRAPHVARPATRLRALSANPDVAISIDTESFPPHVLLVRGRAAITEVDGIAPEYALAAHRYMGDEPAAAYLGHADKPGTRMARIAVRPAWVGLIDFEARLPEVMSG